MGEVAEWYNRGQLNALRSVLWTLKRMHECEHKLTDEQFDEIAAYILSKAPGSAEYKELEQIRDWDYSKAAIE